MNNGDAFYAIVKRLHYEQIGALALAQAIGSVWPENIQISRCCCQLLTHDEASIGAMIEAASQCDRAAFECATEGLIRPDRVHRLWDAALALIAAEHRCA